MHVPQCNPAWIACSNELNRWPAAGAAAANMCNLAFSLNFLLPLTGSANMRHITFPAFAAVILCAAFAAAAVPPGVRAEIDSLLGALATAGCEFNCNGAWHSGAEARAHLTRKLDHLTGRNAVSSAEQFIELGASASSSSGKPYLVKCGGGAPVESRNRLQERLKMVREKT